MFQSGVVAGIGHPPATRAAVAFDLDFDARRGDSRERTDCVNHIQKFCFLPDQFGRQPQLDLAAVPQTSSDQNALRQQPRSVLNHSGRTECAHVKVGRVDHEYGRPTTAQKLSPREIDRLAGSAAFDEVGCLQTLESLHRCQRLSQTESGQRRLQGRRGRDRTRQGGGAPVQPRW